VCVCGAALTAADPTSPIDIGPELRAYKLARAEAVADLREQVGQWAIEDDRTVDDFLAEDARLETALLAFLSAQGDDQAPTLVDGTCRVTLTVPAAAVGEALSMICRLHYDGDAFTPEALAAAAPDEGSMSAQGQAAPVEGQVVEPGEMIPVDSGSYHLEEHLSGEAKAYWTAHVLGRGRLLACQAAREAALAALADRLGEHVLFK